MKVLIIDSAATGAHSVSRRLTDAVAARLGAAGAAIVRRDVGADPLPHLTADTVGAIRGAAGTEAEAQTLALSDALIAELQSADAVVIGAPMYNFGIASTLKVWFDHVLRAGVTFRYTATGPEGLVGPKPVVVIETRGGVYSEGPAAAMDGQEPHLRAMLGFIGLSDPTFVRVEGLAMGADAAAGAIAQALDVIERLPQRQLALAA